MLNLFNTTYISDAENNSSYVEDSPMNSDAASASVFFGMPRRLLPQLNINFNIMKYFFTYNFIHRNSHFYDLSNS